MQKIKNTKKYYKCRHCGMVFRREKLANECELRCEQGLRKHSRLIHNAVTF